MKIGRLWTEQEGHNPSAKHGDIVADDMGTAGRPEDRQPDPGGRPGKRKKDKGKFGKTVAVILGSESPKATLDAAREAEQVRTKKPVKGENGAVKIGKAAARGSRTAARAFLENFLGNSPSWYVVTILSFLLLNPILLVQFGPAVAGWALIGEFIFTLAMALKCYPLQSGGLLALEAVFLGLTSPTTIHHEVEANLSVILLLVFMVAAIHYEREFLMFAFTKLLVRVKNKRILSLIFCFMAAVLSAFLDALTVTAVVITVASGFYAIYHRVASRQGQDHNLGDDDGVSDHHRDDLEGFRRFLRNLMMHGAIGTALGGVTTPVGEPQNLIIAKVMGWEFIEFVLKMLPVTGPVFVVGLIVCYLTERFSIAGYGGELPQAVRKILEEAERKQAEARTPAVYSRIAVQIVGAGLLVVGLALHVAEVGLIGLALLVLLTAFNGVTEEHKLGHAFTEALPFTALLVVFFTIIGVIHDNHLFEPIIHYILGFDGSAKIEAFYAANGGLSAGSDNVFVAGVNISEAKKAFDAGMITREEFEKIAVAINTGTNIPSVATPNGQAAFLFLLTSGLAPLIRLSYGRMVKMALPYTVAMTLTGWLCVRYLL